MAEIALAAAGIGGILGGLQGAQGEEQTNVIQQPSAAAFLPQLFSRAQQASLSPFFAAPDPLQLQALEQQAGIAGDLQGLGSGVLDLGRLTAQGRFLDIGSNPLFQRAQQAAIDPIFDRLEQQTLPLLRSNAIAQGAFGGSRNAVAEGVATGEAAEAAANAQAIAAQQQFLGERQLQQNAPGLLQSGFNLQLAPSQLLFNVGAAQRGFDQQALDSERQNLAFLANIFSPFNEQSPVTTTTGGGILGALSGAFSGAAGGLGLAQGISPGSVAAIPGLFGGGGSAPQTVAAFQNAFPGGGI